MKCRRCKRDIVDNSIFCNWCGHKQLTESTEVRVPKPKRKGNLYTAQVMVDGHRVFISAETENEYYAKARAVKSQLIEIKKATPKDTLGMVIDKYIESQSHIMSPSTIKSYKSYRKHRMQAYMDKRIDEIDYQTMVNEEAKVVGAKTVANAWGIVSASLQYAGFPVPPISLPPIPRRSRPWLDAEQIKVFLEKVYGEDCELAALLALNGLRRSELLALTSDNIDIKHSLIYVRGACVYNEDGKLVRKETNKNATSTRTVHIVIPRLKELLKRKRGQIVNLNPNKLYPKINAVCEEAGLPLVGVHGLRHSYVSLCKHLGVDEFTVMHEGGWANSHTVHRVYTHISEKDTNAEIQKLEKFFTTFFTTDA